MKLYKKIALGAVAVAATASMTSCSDYLDINTNPNSPTITQAKYTTLIPWSQFYMNHIYGIVASNTSYYTGHFYRNNGQQGGAAQWKLDSSTRAGNAQQWFLTQVANNYGPIYNKSMEAGAYHYAAVGKFLKAYGWIMLTDLFGEIPYSDAIGASPSPTYDLGEDIYLGCIADIDEAIELFGRQQEKGAEPLSAADYWNGGDTAKWIKLCYLLKASINSP